VYKRQKVHRDKLVQEILSPVSAFPAHLGLADQGLFAIGYYHQREAFYTAKHVQQDEQ
jgi:CRISPR-associated protein Csd1